MAKINIENQRPRFLKILTIFFTNWNWSGLENCGFQQQRGGTSWKMDSFSSYWVQKLKHNNNIDLIITWDFSQWFNQWENSWEMGGKSRHSTSRIFFHPALGLNQQAVFGQTFVGQGWQGLSMYVCMWDIQSIHKKTYFWNLQERQIPSRPPWCRCLQEMVSYRPGWWND